MRKFLSVLLSILLLLCIPSGCTNRTTAQTEDFSVVASIYPIYIALLNITDGIPDVSVTLMTGTQTGCLHDYTLRPGDMRKLESCDIFVINGAGMESFLDRALQNRAGLPVLDSSTGIDMLESGHDHEEHDDDDHDHETNAHIWTSVTRHIRQVETITDGLCAYDAAHATQYRDNGAQYIARLKTLRADIQERMKDVLDQSVIAFHEAFSYFADEFGPELKAVIEEEPDESPSPQRMKNMAALVEEHTVRYLIVERGTVSASARVIANETGCELLEFDPIVSGDSDPSAYVTGMENNAQLLRQALTEE